MRGQASRWVVDASVGIKLFLPEDHSAQAKSFFEGSSALKFEIYVPDLFYLECANILWKYVRRHGYSATEARQDLSGLKALNFKMVPAMALMEKAFQLSLSLQITAYDACYLALAEEVKATLLTADEELICRAKNRRVQVEWIGDFSTTN